ncbi:transcriptional regulator [Oceaniglobus roseus]|uniref:transcriptional regulator n=1 Tax=Oceaniglobus roseus TaxID=1737570 RepID=UPI000C7F12D9|nr:transcriptional regulator [Kandeliimicrobium roseum]
MRALATLLLMCLPGAALAELSLVMVEQDGCVYCARWDAEIAPAYANTEEGRRAPLRRIDLHEPVPADLELDSAPRLTPTFILVDDGEEVSRIEGYPGDQFFWPMLDALLERAEP